ncbi:MAG: Hsp70 family protein [Thermodesulfobacteriota bacterium]
MPPDNYTNPVLGMDLGTTFSAVARWDGRGPEVYINAMGQNTTQSAVYYDREHEEYLVGQIAHDRLLIDPSNGILGVKRLMDDRNHEIVLGGKVHSPVEISGKILAKMYQDICDMFPKGVFRSRGVVVTVPYYFRAHQCANTQSAAEMAGLTVLGIVQEPVAASLAYALDMVNQNPYDEREENILVFDLGGGTFDLTVFKLTQTKDLLVFEVLGTGGDDRLGGLDFDASLKDHITRQHGIDLSSLTDLNRRIAEQSFTAAVMTAKERLSYTPTYALTVPNIPNKNGMHLAVDITRDEFEKSISHYVANVAHVILQTCMDSNTLAAQKISREEIGKLIDKEGLRGLSQFSLANRISRVIKVGGSSKIPVFSHMLEILAGKDKVYGNINPSLCVAQGAAIFAAHLDDPSVLGRQVQIVARNSHALGVELAGGMFYRLIDVNTKLPAKVTQIFTTDTDSQSELDVNVFQGSSRMARDNSFVGSVHVGGLLPRPAGDLNIYITFEVNREQLVQVTIEERESGILKTQSLKYA